MTMLAEPEAKPLTVGEYLAIPDSRDYELVDGILVERKPTGALADRVAVELIYALVTFCRRTKAGHVFASESTYRCFPNPRTARRGDVSFIRMGRLPGEKIPVGSIDIPADLIVEVVSPTDLAYDVEAKANLYLSNGFGELWVIYPNARTVHVRRRGEPALILSARDTLAGGGPLAGFTCPVNDLFPD